MSEEVGQAPSKIPCDRYHDVLKYSNGHRDFESLCVVIACSTSSGECDI